MSFFCAALACVGNVNLPVLALALERVEDRVGLDARDVHPQWLDLGDPGRRRLGAGTKSIVYLMYTLSGFGVRLWIM